MNKFKVKLARFLYGRYGNDTLNNVLAIAASIIMFVGVLSCMIFLPDVWWLTLIFIAVYMALTAWALSRMLSKNIAARQKENMVFCRFFMLRKNKFRDRKTHVYRKCPSCNANLRLPKAKGKHFVICPRCKNRFEVKG